MSTEGEEVSIDAQEGIEMATAPKDDPYELTEGQAALLRIVADTVEASSDASHFAGWSRGLALACAVASVNTTLMVGGIVGALVSGFMFGLGVLCLADRRAALRDVERYTDTIGRGLGVLMISVDSDARMSERANEH